MNKNDKYFVRIDSNKLKDNMPDKVLHEHIDYIEKISLKIPLLGGGFLNKDGGMVIFKAKDIKQAEKFCKKDPIIKKGYYSYNLFHWEIKIKSLN